MGAMKRAFIQVAMAMIGTTWGGPAFAADTSCVVCGEPTAGEHAVVLDGTAYSIHGFGCRPRWDAALEAGLLSEVPRPVPAGHAAFQSVRLPSPRGPGKARPQGVLAFWIGFWAFVATLSGSLGALLAGLLGRSRVRGFALGFLVPAVGMVLVPVLPARSSRATSKPVEDTT